LKINTKSLTNILTLRYDPLEKPLTPLATWDDFDNDLIDDEGKKTEELLSNSVFKNISDEKSISISLSSGIDSTICLGLVRKIFPEKKITGICGVFGEGFDESVIASEIANQFDADFFTVNMDSVFTQLPELISITKKPKWNTYIHLISKRAKHFSNNLVTGDGADELFGGYTFRYNKFLSITKNDDDWLTKTKNYLNCHDRDWVPDQNDMFGTNVSFDWNNIYEFFKPYFQNKLEPLKQVMLADFNGKLLFDFIPMGKAISSYYQIKNIPIFLDPKVISFAQKISTDQKYDKSTKKGKLLLRKISKKLGINHIEQKKGFSPSLLTDWKNHGRDISKQFLESPNAHIYKNNLIDQDWVRKAFMIVDDTSDLRYLNRLISVLTLEIWYMVEITKELKSDTKL